MTFWRLLPHLTACTAAEAIVLLDVRQDRYFLVPPAIAATTAHWLASPGDIPPPPELLALLERRGVRSAGEGLPGPEIREIALPLTLEESAGRSMLGIGTHLHIDAIVATTWLALRLRPLARLLAQATRKGAGGSRLDPDRLRFRLAAFHQARRLNPLPRNCLLDSLALHRWLARNGHSSRIVLGVATTPFAAHCWLQDEDAILNDHYDRVSRFTPIYAS